MFVAKFFRLGDYRPSGKCDWFKLLTIALPISLLGSFVLAFALAGVFRWGFYLFVIVPLFAGGILGWQASSLFRFAHCRNPYVAAGLGVFLASVMFLGSFHAYLVISRGVRVLTRVDLLPTVINFRMHHNVILDSHDLGNQKKQPNLYMNWTFFVVDWSMAAGLCGAVTLLGARRAYCETCSRWMLSKKATVAPGSARQVVAAVSSKQIGSLPVLPTIEIKRGASATQFELEYCRGNPDQADICPIYMTATDLTPGNQKNSIVARQILLTVEELAELSKKLEFK